VDFPNENTQKYNLGSREILSDENDEITDEDIMIAMQDHELIVKMPPVREYKIMVKVKSITKASPRIIEPEEIDGENISLV
jgi:hypothetical protein